MEGAKTVAVIGGGLAGLVAAHKLKQAGLEPVVLEAEPQTGGKVGRRSPAEGLTFDLGPNTVLESNPALAKLLDELGLRERVLWADESAKARYVLKDGRMVALPASPQGFLATPLLSPFGKARLLWDLFAPKGPAQESVEAFVLRRFGRQALDYAVNPFLIGTHASKPSELSAALAFKAAKLMEQTHGSVIRGGIRQVRAARKNPQPKPFSGRMFSFPNGLYELVERLEAAANVRRGVSVTRLEFAPGGVRVGWEGGALEAAACVLAVPADAASGLLGAAFPELSAGLGRVSFAPVAQVFLAFPAATVSSPRGFGVLVPEAERRGILGVVFNSSIFPARFAGHTVLTAFVGGTRDPERLGLSDAEMVTLARNEIASVLGVTAEPAHAHVARWERGIPQFGLQHAQVLSEADKAEQQEPRLALVGNWRSGVSVPDTVQQAAQAADRLAKSLKREVAS